VFQLIFKKETCLRSILILIFAKQTKICKCNLSKSRTLHKFCHKRYHKIKLISDFILDMQIVKMKVLKKTMCLKDSYLFLKSRSPIKEKKENTCREKCGKGYAPS
jgi:hypothetical protein